MTSLTGAQKSGKLAAECFLWVLIATCILLEENVCSVNCILLLIGSTTLHQFNLKMQFVEVAEMEYCIIFML